MKKVDPNYFSILTGVYFLHFFLKMLQSKSRFFRGAFGAKPPQKNFMPKIILNGVSCERIFLIGGLTKKIQPLEVAHIRMLISHWLRYLSKILLHCHDSQPFSFPIFKNLQNRVKIERAMSKNVRSSNFFWNFLEIFKNFRGLFGALKLEIFLKKRYFWVTLDRHYPFLRLKTKSKNLPHHL